MTENAYRELISNNLELNLKFEQLETSFDQNFPLSTRLKLLLIDANKSGNKLEMLKTCNVLESLDKFHKIKLTNSKENMFFNSILLVIFSTPPDLDYLKINTNDFVIGIAASGTTPYVIGGLKECQKNNISTGCIVCNENSPLSKYADYKVEVIVGPEFLTGSSRLKAGTAQKLILNMISTISMILDGHVRGNKMIDMQMTNAKLNKRARKIIMEELDVDAKKADELIIKHKSIRSAIDNYSNE